MGTNDNQGITPKHLRNLGNLSKMGSKDYGAAPTNNQNSLDEALQLFVTNIEHDGSYIPVSAIKAKFPEVRAAINKTIMEDKIAELEAVLTMNGWHEGDGKQAIKERIAELKKYGRTE